MLTTKSWFVIEIANLFSIVVNCLLKPIHNLFSFENVEYAILFTRFILNLIVDKRQFGAKLFNYLFKKCYNIARNSLCPTLTTFALSTVIQLKCD